jgi:hypothetical protein
MNNTIKIIVIILVSLGIGFFAEMEYKAYQVRSALQDVADEVSNVFDTADQSENQLPVENEEDITYVDKTIGEEVVLATIKFKVTNSSEKQTLSGNFGSPAIAKEGAKFVVIDLNITNTTEAPFTFFPDDGFRLIDDKNRQFTTYGDTIGKVNNYLDVRELSLGIAENGVLVYEIPQDSESYSFAVGKGGTSDIYRIKLK